MRWKKSKSKKADETVDDALWRAFGGFRGEFKQSGSLPFSSKYSGPGFRYHSRKHFHQSPELFKSFEDAPRKWDAKERYAPAGFVSGHFFACNAAGAAEEAKHYGVDAVTRVRLDVDFDFLDNILDLTWEENILSVLGAIWADPPGSAIYLLRALSHEETGGNPLTDDIGNWALRQGYTGVKFFGARALGPYRNDLEGTDNQWGVYVAGDTFDTLRKDMTIQNLVIYSGLDATRAIRRYRVSSQRESESASPDWCDNVHFGARIEELDDLTEYGTAYRQERLDNVERSSAKAPRIISWDGRVRRPDG